VATKIRILLADEDPDSRVELRRAIQRAQLASAGEVGFGMSAISYAVETRPDIILLSLEEPAARPLQTAERLTQALPETPLIVVSSVTDPGMIRRAMLAGARDYLFKPLQAAQLLESVTTVLEQLEQRRRTQAGQVKAVGRGTVVLVTGAKGGIGKTVVAVNLALGLRLQAGQSVVLVDADSTFGDVATMLDMRPDRTIVELFPAADRLDRNTIQQYLTPHPTGLQVLAGPADGAGWEGVNVESLKKIIDLLAQVFDFVVVDTAGSFDRTVRSLAEVATLILVVTSGEVSSIRDTAGGLARLQMWGIDPARVKVILNRTVSGDGVKPADIKQGLGHDIFWEIPYDRAVGQSVQLGEPLVLNSAGSATARRMRELALRVAGLRRPTTPPAAEPKPKSGSLLSRLLFGR
jgi:pilus assembly protein CpaE